MTSSYLSQFSNMISRNQNKTNEYDLLHNLFFLFTALSEDSLQNQGLVGHYSPHTHGPIYHRRSLFHLGQILRQDLLLMGLQSGLWLTQERHTYQKKKSPKQLAKLGLCQGFWKVVISKNIKSQKSRKHKESSIFAVSKFADVTNLQFLKPWISLAKLISFLINVNF